ncbi:hypothetical protein [Bacillus sp. FSL K6-3431]|uniref:hypothetical protein n=1 Tax=Bacillus sp. FSL K6-3431 TaxID=2921500 RepID=UPI0030FB4551
MGYISMVPIYQYQQYNDRIELAEKTQYPISGVEQVQKADIRSKFHKTLEERIHEEYRVKQYSEKKKKEDNQNVAGHPYMMAKLTGKGRKFNEYV